MAQARTLDGNILSWVKNEIDVTMNQARQALETHVEKPDDQTQLQFCLNYLHQVSGTLQMVELYGASMLAEELERLTQSIIDNHVTKREDAYEVLMRGMMQLPDYLEKLQAGQPDYPIILLPLLNDSRAVRKAGLLSESALFSPNLEVDAPIPMERAEHPINTLARKLRHAYHLGLLDWFRGNDARSGLKKIGAVIEKLRHSANDPDASRMLWAASGVVEALQDKGIDSSAAVKILLGQVDRHVKKIIDQGEFALSNEPPRDLLKNLLYYVASSNSAGSLVKEIKDAFHLANVMPDKETLNRARADLAAPNAALMQTVSSVLLDDLTQIKDTLDVFMRSANRDVNTLTGMSDKLAQMADTLGMLGFGDQRHILQDQIKIMRGMIAGSHQVDEPALMDMAGALLGIEEILLEPKAKVLQPEKPASADDSLARSFIEPEQRKLIKRVVDEAKVDLSVIKDAFNEYGRTPKQIQLLKDVPGLLDRIRGSLSMLALDRAANILKSAATYVQTKILQTNIRPEVHTLELLADSISSVEYYLESLVDSWGHPNSILEVAEQSLLDLGINAAESTSAIAAPTTADKQADSVGNTLVDLPMPELADDQNETLQMGAPEIEMGDGEENIDATLIDIEGFDDLAHLNRADDITEPDVEGSISQEFNLPFNETTPAKPVVTAPTVPTTQKTAIADELDEEIVEIFMEEADEEHANISRLLPTWFNNPENETALKDLRRSFHTLKGSGRLVGALDVGEFAWAFENMLNRVIDHTIEHSPEMFALMDAARDKLPELLQLFRTGGKPGQEVFNIMARAEAFSQGKPVKPATSTSRQEKSEADPIIAKSSPDATTPDIGVVDLDTDLPGFDQPEDTDRTPVYEMSELEPDLLELDLQDDSEPTVTQQVNLDSVVQFERKKEQESVPEDNSETDTVDAIESFDLDTIHLPEDAPATAGADSDELEYDATEIISLPVPSIDPALLDIYRKEIETHLISLAEYIAQWYAGKDRTANSKLIRAIHTIKGSSRTANVPDVADLCGILEDYLRVLDDTGSEVDEELINLLQDTRKYTDRTVKILDIPGAITPDNTELLARAHALSARQPVAAVSVEEFAPQPKPKSVAAKSNMQSEEGADPDKTPDYDTELLEIFLEEGVDILNDSDQTLHAWSAEPDDKDHVKALQRQLHTLKGGARMAGVTEIGDLSHSIENLLTAIAEHDLPVNSQMLRVLQKAQDRLVGMLDIVRDSRAPRNATQLIHIINELAAGNVVDEALFESFTPETTATAIAEVIEIDIPLSDAAQLETVEEVSVVGDVPDTGDIEEITVAAQAEPGNVLSEIEELSVSAPEFADVANEFAVAAPVEQAVVQRTRAEQIRVRAELLDNLVNFAGEVSIYRSRMDQQNNAFRYNIKELDDTVTRLRDQLRKFEIETETQIQFRYEEAGTINADFDPLEMDRFTQMQTLSRGMLESLNDLDSLRSILNNLTRESETLLLQQSRVNTELQEGLMRTRMVPISGQVPRLRRIVRQAADEVSKHAELHVEGADNELDRTVLERVMSPLEHMLRNALAHGIESPDIRAAAGKPKNGTIHLNFARESSDIVITVTDDGGGLNLEAIRKKAVEKGILKPDARPSKESLIDLILESGFSTAETVTQLAGRGVGMDVVNNEIKQLGGHLEIKTEAGKGSTFRISMPVSLSVARALLVHVSENTYAIPLIGVETVERVPRAEIIRMQAERDSTYRWLENDYQYIHLSSTLGLTDLLPPLEEQRTIPLLLVRSGEFRAAVHVDSLIGSREIVVKPVGPQLSTLRGISGATIMGDGSVILILDLGVLMRITAVEHLPQEDEIIEAVAVEVPEKRIPLAMVVDDSITVRKVTTRFLERNNFRTISAKDGVDALTQLQEQRPDIMLLDVEMPRMDGFELATNIRNDAALRHIPIIMITSRTGQKHRDRALGIGVNIYMGKPYSEAELLDNINKLLSN